MPAASDSALLLADQLRSSSDDRLRALLAERGIRAAGIRDFFDLADALLGEASLQVGLQRLDRHSLAAIAALPADGAPVRPDDLADRLSDDHVGGRLDAAADAALVLRTPHGFAALPAVSAAMAASSELPPAEALATEPPPATLGLAQARSETIDRVAAERAFDTVAAAGDVVEEIARQPARQLARGGLALPDAKRLAEASGAELDDIEALVGIVERAGLVRRSPAEVVAEESPWRSEPTAARWAVLAGAWLEALPLDVRTLLGSRARSEWGDRLDGYIEWLYPLGGDWMRARVAVYSRDAALLGITADHVPSSAGAALLESGPSRAARVLAALLPDEVRSAYLQQDLTVVVPGPLATDLERRLRSVAHRESRGLASTWRITGAAITRALAAGETVAGIRRFLGELSLTGIPQPLEYALAEAENRFGLVRVAAVGSGSRIVSPDDAILRAIEVDRAVAAIGLRRDGDGLVSRFDRDLVYFSLSDARYPVVAEDAAGRTVIPERRAPHRPAAPTSDPIGDLLARLRSDDPGDSDEAWIARQLDVAARGKLEVTVSVRLPDGSTADYRLAPSSVAGGRLRARDRKADLERTLPLTSIAAVRPTP